MRGRARSYRSSSSKRLSRSWGIDHGGNFGSPKIPDAPVPSAERAAGKRKMDTESRNAPLTGSSPNVNVTWGWGVILMALERASCPISDRKAAKPSSQSGRLAVGWPDSSATAQSRWRPASPIPGQSSKVAATASSTKSRKRNYIPQAMVRETQDKDV